jgi:hypothetical protein
MAVDKFVVQKICSWCKVYKDFKIYIIMEFHKVKYVCLTLLVPVCQLDKYKIRIDKLMYVKRMS